MSAAIASAGHAPLLSPHWFRVASLRPRLDPQVHAERVSYRRQTWHVLVRADGSRSFRLDQRAYAFAARCDGSASMQRLWDLLLAELKDAAPTQDELLALLSRLHDAGLVGFDRRPDFGQQGALGATAQPATHEAAPAKNSLLSFRVPLGQPDGWLARLAPQLSMLFSRTALLVWALVVLAGLVAALVNAAQLAAFARQWLDTPRLLLLAWLAYPVVKALHELAHALVLKHFGARVPEWGISLMMFTPVPYVDASAATALPRPAQRFAVSAAGIAVELFLAAIGLLVALQVEPGWLHDAALAVFFIGSVSTLLVNGNPLMRFDGYHMLGDALQLPNLATRSTRHWLATLRGLATGERQGGAVQAAAGEVGWLWAYAPAALAWRVLVSVGLVAWVGSMSFVLGAMLALYLGWTMLAQPLLRLVRWLRGTALADAPRRRALLRVGLPAAGAVLLLAGVPMPFASVAEGVVWLPEQALVRAGASGFVAQLHVADGEKVRAGQLLVTLHAPALEADVARLDGEIQALETEGFQALRRDAARAVDTERALDAARAELAHALAQQQQLAIVAGADGVVAIPRAADLPGRFVKQGSTLAQVLTDAPATVRVALPQAQATLVQGDTRGVQVRLAEDGSTAWPATLLGGATGAVSELPSAALGDHGGGDIVTDPADRSGRKTAEAVVLADVRLAGRPASRTGGRATVRFDHGWSPLALQAARGLQQLLLQHFNPAQ